MHCWRTSGAQGWLSIPIMKAVALEAVVHILAGGLVEIALGQVILAKINHIVAVFGKHVAKGRQQFMQLRLIW